jgi:hypothetical protein
MGKMTQETGKRRNTRRFLTACLHEGLYKGGLSAAVLPPPTLRTSMFARHSRRFTTQNSLFRFTGDPSHWRSRGRQICGIGLLKSTVARAVVCDRTRESIMILATMGLNSDYFFDQPFKAQNHFQNDQFSLSNS